MLRALARGARGAATSPAAAVHRRARPLRTRMGRPFLAASQQDEAPSVDDTAKRTERLARWRELVSTSVQGERAGLDSGTVDSVLEWMYDQRRTGYAMQAEVPTGGPLDRTASKLGGLPYLVPGESWPVSGQASDSDTQLMFVWQLQVSEMPTAMQETLGCREGLFQFFLDEELPGYDIDSDRDYYLVRILTPEQLSTDDPSGAAQPNSSTRVLTEKAITGWEEVDDWPHLEDWDTEGAPDKQAVETILEVLNNASEAECVGGDKGLGWPRWCQGPEWGHTSAEGEGARQRYLQFLQFEAEHCGDEFIVGDCGTLVIQRDPTRKAPPHFLVGWACC